MNVASFQLNKKHQKLPKNIYGHLIFYIIRLILLSVTYMILISLYDSEPLDFLDIEKGLIFDDIVFNTFILFITIYFLLSYNFYAYTISIIYIFKFAIEDFSKIFVKNANRVISFLVLIGISALTYFFEGIYALIVKRQNSINFAGFLFKKFGVSAQINGK